MEPRVQARLTAAEGRNFGFTIGVALLVLASLVYFWRHKATAGAVLGALGTLLVVAALAMPSHLGPLQRVWMGLAKAISKITTPVFLAIVFFGIMTPIGLLMRLFGRHPLVHRERSGGFWAAPVSGGRSDVEHQF